MVLTSNTRRKQKGNGEIGNDQLTEEQCQQLIENPFVHPVTKKPMEIGSETHNNLMKQCSQILASKDLAQEIMVHITNDTSIVARDFCADAVNNATSINEIYDPLSKTKREITSVYSKTLLENCKNMHNIMFLHLQIDDDGIQTFIPLKFQKNGYQYKVGMYFVRNALKIINGLIDRWARPDYHVNVATIDALVYGLTNITKTNARNMLDLYYYDQKELDSLVERLNNLKAMIETGVHDSTRVPEHMKTQLKQKAEQARQKAAYKRKMNNGNCFKRKITYKNYYALMLQKYLSGFITSKSLDTPLEQFYAENKQELYTDSVFEQVSTENYIFLPNQDKQARIRTDWLRKQNKYILSLSTEQLFNIYGYTHHGDEQVNNYLRGTFDEQVFKHYITNVKYAEDGIGIRYFPLFFSTLRFINMHYKHTNIVEMTDQLLSRHFQSYKPVLKGQLLVVCHDAVSTTTKYRVIIEHIIKDINIDTWKRILDIYGNSLEEVIRNAPRITEPMYLFRGVKTDYYLKNFMESRKRLFKPRSFVSTTSSIAVAEMFTAHTGTNVSECCFKRIFVPAGKSLLLVTGLSQHEEAEFLLSKDSTFYIEKSTTETSCENVGRQYNMRVTDMTLM